MTVTDVDAHAMCMCVCAYAGGLGTLSCPFFPTSSSASQSSQHLEFCFDFFGGVTFLSVTNVLLLLFIDLRYYLLTPHYVR